MMQGTGQAFPASIPASIKGWDAISSVADMPPDHAIVLDNSYLDRDTWNQGEARRCFRYWTDQSGRNIDGLYCSRNGRHQAVRHSRMETSMMFPRLLR